MVNTLFDEEVVGYNRPALFYLAKSIDMIGQVDAVYFTEDWRSARGCRVERKICEEYGVKILDPEFLGIGTEHGTVKRCLDTMKQYENIRLGKHDENGEFEGVEIVHPNMKNLNTYYEDLKWNNPSKGTPLTNEEVSEIFEAEKEKLRDFSYWIEERYKEGTE